MQPRAQPLNILEELLSWTPQALQDSSYCRGTTLLSQNDVRRHAARLLVCHDMNGGYLEDAWALGGSDCGAFSLTHWHLIDIFVYFSHHLVTIPPPGWINCSHLHGTQVLGTFITEWDEGARQCEAFLANVHTAEHAARQLAAIAAYYRFEGWLVNIENRLQPPAVPVLIHFLRTLRRLMHEQCAASLVVWYDAVTTEGELVWQNTLNGQNSPFFDAADAIFLNYAWKAGTPGEAAERAGSRRQDVFMGIDVFGRGTYGGGQLNCDVAAAAARNAGASVALFAPGWVYEGEGNSRAAWRRLDEQLWSSLGAVLGSGRPMARRLPFETTFDVGAGRATWHQGRCASNAPWFNLSRQLLQPLFQSRARVQVALLPSPDGAAVSMSALEACIDQAAAYEGGSSLRLHGVFAPCAEAFVLELFHADLPVPPGGLRIRCAVQEEGPLQLSIQLRLGGGRDLPLTGVGCSEAACGAIAWTVREFAAHADQRVPPGSRVSRIRLRCSRTGAAGGSFSGSLGLLSIAHLESPYNPAPPPLDIQC